MQGEAPGLARGLADAVARAWLAGAATVAEAVPAIPQPTGVAPVPEPPLAWPGMEAAAAALRSRRIAGLADLRVLAVHADAAGKQTVQQITGQAGDDLARMLAEEGIGGTLAGFKRRVEAALDGSSIAPHRLEAVYRTSTAQAVAQGLDEVLNVPLVGDHFPYVETVPIFDDRLSELCEVISRSGLQKTGIFRRDDPTWIKFRPPRHVNCILPGTVVQGTFFAGLKAFYYGKAVEITTRSGQHLSVTANHPVLTLAGFVPAASLKEGQHLLRYRRPVEERPNLDGMSRPLPYISGFSVPAEDVQHAPARIEDVFRSLIDLQGGVARRSPTRPDDLHGDAAFIDGQIEIAAPQRVLWIDGHADSKESGSDLRLVGVDMGAVSVPGDGAAGQLVSRTGVATDSGPGSGALPRRRARLSFEAGPFEGFRLGAASDLHASRYESVGQHVATDAAFARDLLERYAADVSLDEIVEIRHYEWNGHIYDLQSPGGWIVAANLFVSNCRCAQIPMTIADAAEAGIREAVEWQRTGEPPVSPAWVPTPKVELPKGWQPGGTG